jgi:hypothetical protein
MCKTQQCNKTCDHNVSTPHTGIDVQSIHDCDTDIITRKLEVKDTNLEKLELIDKVSNLIQLASEVTAKELAYLIHRIVETEDVTLAIYEEVAKWQITFR